MSHPNPLDPDTKVFHQVLEAQHNAPYRDGEGSSSDSAVDTDVQHGIQEIEAVTLSWSKASLLVAFALIWLVYFVQGLVGGISGALLPYVTSDFAMHSLTATTSVMSSVIGGVTNLSIAKTLDVFGRPQGFMFCAIIATIGLIMSAACNNVEAYAASQVFYTVGINGVGYSLSVFIADTTSLRNRGLIQSICASPNIITAWIGGPIATAFLKGAGWRWAFGMESILVPFVTIPLFSLFMVHYQRAKSQGLMPNRESNGSFLDATRYYIREFDLVGLLSLSAGVALFLLPFNLYTMQAKGFGSPMIICFFVFGILLLIFFGIWERFFAKVSFIPWRFLLDRTVTGACLLSFSMFFSAGCWALYLTSILQVVNNLSVTNASYIVSAYTVGGFLFAILIGWILSYTGNFKATTLYAALPFATLGTGLMIFFRQPDQSVGYIVISQLILAVGSGSIMITAEIAILAAVNDQQYFAVAIALVSMCSSIGQAVGLTVSSAIWQDVIPRKLAEYLPEEDLPNLPIIAADIVTQLSFPVGSPTRLAIQHAYGDAHKLLFIAGTAAWVLGFVGTLMWKNINIKNIKQTKGRVA
ncbi:unnamed protein product [Fusarium graminearum]|uniref:Uncharacterized protein n=1 Tax=Gibberella zeae TaxID=5518 RepID=A0A4U9FGB2_GIBZA|nr:hypothetical protein FG05_03737 [Fusarium graminearum]KAI6774213.1 hypothetical protein HG531_001062 [Fusarium graminearum]CAG2016316.1 unnamed protein product [Fusarium graminearum]VTO92864.1 unnamed protein product [Fusarium graminearum]